MTPAEVETFRAQPDWRLALELREIDDQGKVPGARVPGLDDYRADLEALVAGKGPHSFRQSTS